MKAILKPGIGTHRYKVILYEDGEGGKKIKTINFGARNYSNYTIHKNDERRKRYLDRHKTNENWNDPLTPGFWSRWLLWEKKTIDLSKKYISSRWNIKFDK